MPTYEYACRSCAEHLEVVQSFKDEPLTMCGACGGSLRKVFSPIGIAFKGSGFYRNDSRGASRATGEGTRSKEPASSAAAASADSKSGDSKSGDSKSGESGPGSKTTATGPSGRGKSGSASPPGRAQASSAAS